MLKVRAEQRGRISTLDSSNYCGVVALHLPFFLNDAMHFSFSTSSSSMISNEFMWLCVSTEHSYHRIAKL